MFTRSSSSIIKQDLKKKKVGLQTTNGQNGHHQKVYNNKCWRGCREKWTLLHCWWECKLVQSLWKTVWKFLKKLHIELLCDPAILHPGMRACSVAQSCLTLCNPVDCSPPGSSVHGDFPGMNTGVGCHFLLQCMKVKSLSRVQLFATPWISAYQAPPSMGFSRQEYWSGVPI